MHVSQSARNSGASPHVRLDGFVSRHHRSDLDNVVKKLLRFAWQRLTVTPSADELDQQYLAVTCSRRTQPPAAGTKVTQS